MADERVLIKESTLTAIGNSIRSKTGKTELINPDNMPAEIDGIQIGGGSESGGTGSETVEGYKVRYFDINGRVLKTEYVKEGGKLAPPDNPTYDSEYLEFNTWNYDIKNYVVERDTDVGAIYRTKTGDTYLFIRLTESIGLTIPSMSISGVTSIDWGDGTVDTNLTHTYADYGEYVIKISGMTSTTKYLFGGASSVYNYCLQKCCLGNSVTSIGNDSFNSCYSLTGVTIPEGVASIGNNVFDKCYSLTSITIPESVTSIGNNVFDKCYSLTSITIPESVTSIGKYAFQYCHSLTSITVPNSVTSIGLYAFNECYSLTSITIPEGVTSIGSYAFRNCYSLTSITTPESVTSIGVYAFSQCYSLTSITTSENVTSIGNYAFQSCYSLTNYILNCNSVPSLSNTNAFSSINKSTIIWVKDELVDAYKSATNWSSYAIYIKPISVMPEKLKKELGVL